MSRLRASSFARSRMGRSINELAYVRIEDLPAGPHTLVITAETAGLEYAFAVDAVGVWTS